MSSQPSALPIHSPTPSGILRSLLKADPPVQLRSGGGDGALGCFPRLRVPPAPTWPIMVSRLAVQIVSMLAMSVVVLVAAAVIVNVSLDPAAYLLTLLAVIFSSAVFLGVGQALVGLIKSSDTVNAVGRLSFLR